MKSIAVLLKLINGYKTYASVILAIVSGIGAILTKDYSQGLNQICQGVLVLTGGASLAGMRHAVAKIQPRN